MPDTKVVKVVTNSRGDKKYIFSDGTTKIVRASGKSETVKKSVTPKSKPSSKKSGFVPYAGDTKSSVDGKGVKREARWNKSRYTGDELERLARQKGYTGPSDNKSLQEWAMEQPGFKEKVDEWHNLYGMPKAGKEADGYWGIRWDYALNAIPDLKPEEEVKAPAEKEPVKEKDIEPVYTAPKDETPKRDDWWLPDSMNLMGALTDDINKYPPVMGKIDLEAPGYTLMDPTRQLAANQEQQNALLNLFGSTLDAPQAAIAALAASGQGFANAANVLGQTQNQNVGIVNEAAKTKAAIANQENVANENSRLKYHEDLAVMNQQYDNAKNARKWRQINAFNKGTDNYFKKKWMEDVMFPQVHVDPITGDVDFSGEGRDVFGLDTYQNPVTNAGKTTSIEDKAAIIAKIRKDNPTLSDSDIASLVKTQFSTGRGRKNAPNYGAYMDNAFGK